MSCFLERGRLALLAGSANHGGGGGAAAVRTFAIEVEPHPLESRFPPRSALTATDGRRCYCCSHESDWLK